jgi:hypothetical protein
MVKRRHLLVGSAAVLGTLTIGTGKAAASVARSAFPTVLPQAAVMGFNLPGGLVCPVPFMSRAAWGADESWRFINGAESWPPEHWPVQALTVHHSGFAASSDPADTVRTIYKWQALTPAQGGNQGWGDIGYNLLIDANGVVYEGRHSGSSYPIFGSTDRLMTTGAHVLYFNTGNIGVCLLGDLNDTPATQAAQDSLVTVLAYLAAVSGVNPQGSVNYYNPVARPDGTHSAGTYPGLAGHRNWAATECPGNAEYPLLGSIRQQVAAAMPAAPRPSPTQTGTPSTSPSPSPSPGASGQPAPTTTGPAPTTTQPTGSSSGEKGGDEYVAAARKASPSAFPTKAPPPPSPSPSPSPTVDSMVSPSTAVTPTLTGPAVVADVTPASGSGWNVGATAAGIAAAGGALGSLGGWWWKRRRSTQTTSTSGEPKLTMVDEPSIVEEPALVRKSTVDEQFFESESTVDSTPE